MTLADWELLQILDRLSAIPLRVDYRSLETLLLVKDSGES
ncbi:hypothetical protein Mic7113_2316 [Allocoleopsis franciscana PCC 7113]|uniref:Uncharacterized protein n=1 Tax=Allocoleopsis franciscana PCC 7113 TaxID=1173027 RepID=K9WEA3_9CYAN|nr:hypothetical protein Mic7113_2316 [Allocoleopsis franciscana PCC 7113]